MIAATGVVRVVTSEGEWETVTETITTFQSDKPIREYNWLEQRC